VETNALNQYCLISG